MDSDIKWFLGFIGVFALLWIAGGGVNADRSKRPFVRPLTEGGGTYGEDFLPGTAKNKQTIKQSKPTADSISKDLEQAKDDAEKIKTALDELETYSPLRGKLTLSKYSSARGDDPNTEQIRIRASSQNTAPILLSGLKLKSTKSGAEAVIGNGSEIAMPGTSKNYDPIYLAPSGYAYVSSGRSPISVSFRLNICTGYFEQNNNYTPSISRQCPLIADEPLPQRPNQLSDSCLDFIEDIGRCTIPESIPLYIDPSCQAWIAREATYNRCVERHRGEAGFLKDEWRIYLNYDQPIWKKNRETIQLLDTAGKIISEISY